MNKITSDTLLLHTDRNVRVMAAPGSGKTYWLAEHRKNVIKRSSKLPLQSRGGPYNPGTYFTFLLEERFDDYAKIEIPAVQAKPFVGVAPVRGDGHSRIEPSHFIAPPVVADHCIASANALAYLCVMLVADCIDETLGRFRNRGTTVRVSAQIAEVSGSTGDP